MSHDVSVYLRDLTLTVRSPMLSPSVSNDFTARVVNGLSASSTSDLIAAACAEALIHSNIDALPWHVLGVALLMLPHRVVLDPRASEMRDKFAFVSQMLWDVPQPW